MFHACAARYDVTKNLKLFINFFGNYARPYIPSRFFFPEKLLNSFMRHEDEARATTSCPRKTRAQLTKGPTGHLCALTASEICGTNTLASPSPPTEHHPQARSPLTRLRWPRSRHHSRALSATRSSIRWSSGPCMCKRARSARRKRRARLRPNN